MSATSGTGALARAFLLGVLILPGCKSPPADASNPALPPPIPRTSITRAGERSALSRPIASPTAGPTTSSHFSVSLRSVGSVPFDSLNLPLLSPDGRFVASQHGSTPGWPAVLADGSRDSLSVPPGLTISAWRIPDAASPAGSSLAPVLWRESLPKGLLMGRSADDRGFLVESPRPQGIAGASARWIGRVDWQTGHLDWLVGGPGDSKSPETAAFATLGPSCELAYCRLRPGMPPGAGGPFELVVRRTPSDSGSESVLASPDGTESYVFPTYSHDSRFLYALVISAAPEVPLAIIVVQTGGPDLRIVARANLNVAASMGAAYQSVSVLQTPIPSPPGLFQGAWLKNGLAFPSLESGYMAWIDGESGSVTPLARGTIGAAPLLSRSGSRPRFSGFLLGTARELVFQPVSGLLPQDGPVPCVPGVEAAVVPGGFIPRFLSRMEGGIAGYVLFRPPMAGKGDSVELLKMFPVETTGKSVSQPLNR